MGGMVAGWTTTPRRPLEQERTSSTYFWDVILGLFFPSLLDSWRFSSYIVILLAGRSRTIHAWALNLEPQDHIDDA
jgi:hypothetical protein